MSDRRRINGPASGTQPALFQHESRTIAQPHRSRKPNELRRLFLQTGLVPAASGSAYLELEAPRGNKSFVPTTSTIKLSCAIQGPKPLSRNAHFSPNLHLTASVKFAPFATRKRRGYLRDNVERDLGSHLQNALNGVIIPDRYPKSALEVAVTVLEGEEDCLWNEDQGQEKGVGGIGLMNVLAASINVAVAALVDAKIDCLDMLSAGVAAQELSTELLDPCPSEHEELSSACVVGYLPNRDELVEVWCKSTIGTVSDGTSEDLINAAIKAARGTYKVLTEVIKESLEQKSKLETAISKEVPADDSMKT
ncbi:3'-5'-exoribonuclease [Lithohypha guttulata]|uniref:3'-5'-exoribonuclease n=1 Tax=Lithohypha guttulata TaxID=1690604 RepID=A0AAN7T0C5_9EURO|nr:3'-5'-exoribonuclease [Lithohypha guttulata]